MNAVTEVVDESYTGLMSPEFYSGVAGVAVGGVLGSAIDSSAFPTIRSFWKRCPNYYHSWFWCLVGEPFP